MADRKITDLTALTTPASADVLPIVDVSEAAAADKNKKVTVGELFKGIPDGTAAAPAIAFESDDGNGFFLSTTDTIGIATNGVSRATVSTTAVTSTLPVIVPDGSAAAPSVAFTGSGTDTGLYSPGADQVAISTNGTGRLFVDASGRVGVGTSSPTTTIDLVASSAKIRIQDTSSGGEVAFWGCDTVGAYIRTFINDTFRFMSTGGERLRITSAGLVGIGTSSPSDIVHINKASTAATVAYLSNTGGEARIGVENNSGTGVLSGAGAYDTVIRTAASTGISFGIGYTAPAIRIDSSGRLGIGTTSPSFPLDVRPVGVATARVGSQDNQAGFQLSSGNASNPFFSFLSSTSTLEAQIYGVAGSAAMVFATGASATERARIDSSGRLLVGTSTARSDFYNGTFTPTIQLEGLGSASSYFSCVSNANSGGNEAGIVLGKSRGTSLNSKTIVQSGDSLGYVVFQGADGSDLVSAAVIGAEVDGTPGANDMPGRLVFSTTADGASSPTERMRIIQQGHVKISSNGTYNGSGADYHEIRQSVSNTLLYCSHSFNFGATAGNYGQVIDFAVHSPDNNSSSFLTCKDQTANRMFIYSDGDVWTSDAGILTSDETLKRDITDASPKLADVMNLRVRNFYWEEDYHPNKQDKKLIGFVAQEFEKVFPGLVSEHRVKDGDPILDENGNDTGEKTPDVFKKGIKEAKLVPILVKALQEAVERIEALEAEVAALKAQ